jgi:hypothetical protein
MNKMQFTTYKKMNSTQPTTVTPNVNVNSSLPMMSASSRNIQLRMQPNNIQSRNIPVVDSIPVNTRLIYPTLYPPHAPTIPTDPKLKKMKWGEPTWFLFHTLASKIKDEYFLQVRTELLNNIYAICANLPCPTCAAHAMEYMKSINFNTIRTKDDLKLMLFNFHNTVNLKKGFALFPYEQLDEKYSNAITYKIIYNFMAHYQDKHKSIHMIANDLYRSRQVVILKEWFNQNIQYFDV